MVTLKEKSISGFIWSFINTGGTQILGLIFGIVLARLLEPSDFGNIAIVVFFTAIANVFVDSGLSHALIRDQNTKLVDYNSVFLFGLIIAMVCSLLLYLFSSYIAHFYNEQILSELLKILSISPLIHAMMSIQSVIITKSLDFKLKAKLSLISITVANVVAVFMALNGYGIWSLLVMQMLNPLLLMILLWIYVDWKPQFNFSLNSIKKYIDFGIKLSISNFINVFYKSVYVLIIGKYYSSAQVGFYTRADSLKNLPAVTLDKIIQRVSYPLLSKLQDDSDNLLQYNIKIIKFTALIVVPIMFGMSALSEPLIVTLIGEKWLPSAEFLSYLCVVGVFYPFHSANMNVIKVHGDMSLFLKIDIFKILLLLPVLYIGVTVGMIEMLIGMIFHSIIIFLISAAFSTKIIGYRLTLYINDIIKIFILSMVMAVLVYFSIKFLSLDYYVELFLGVFIGVVVMIGFFETFKIVEYLEIKSYIFKGIKGVI